jgi:HEAT repeat protein
MGLFGPPDIEKMKSKRDVKGLTKALDYQKDPAIRRMAVEALAGIGDANVVEPIISVLSDGEKSVCSAAIVKLGIIKDARAIQPLIGILKGSDKDLCKLAAVSLGKIRDPRAIEPLITALKDANIRLEAKEALVNIGEPAVKPLIDALNKLLNKRQDEEDREWFYAIISALGDLGGTLAIQQLISLLKPGRYLYNRLAAEALEDIGWKPNQDENGAWYWMEKENWEKCVEIGAPAVEPLAQFYYSSSKSAKDVIGALSKLGRPGAERLIELLKNNDIHCSEIVRALDEVGWQPGKDENGLFYWKAKGDLNKCMEIDASATLKMLIDHLDEAAVQMLIKIGSPAIEPLISKLKNNTAPVAQILGEIGDERAVEPLIDAFKENSKANWGWMVTNRQAVARALIKLYQLKKLDSKYSKLILEQRDEITREHLDSPLCGEHADSGPVIDFPL